MNAGPDVERLIAGWLEEEAPGRAPDRILVAAGRTIDRTKQRRFVAWRPSTMLERLAAAAVSTVLAIGALTLGAFLTRTSDPAAAPCPAAFDESEAIDTFRPGLAQSERSWGTVDGAPRGAPSNGAIAAFEGLPNGVAVLAIDPETGTRCRLATFATRYQLASVDDAGNVLDWSPSGDALAIGFDGQLFLWTPTRLLRAWVSDVFPVVAWAPDGSSIAVGNGPDGSDETVAVRSPGLRQIFADGSPDRTLADIDPFRGWLRWSPDGSRWVVAQRRGEPSGLTTAFFLVDVANGRIAPLEIDGDLLALIDWIDAERVLFSDSTRDVGITRLLTVPVSEPQSPVIVPFAEGRPVLSKVVLSPDGSRLAYAVDGKVAIVDLESPAAEPIEVTFDGEGVGFAIAWSPDGAQLLFQTQESVEGELVTFGLWTVNADGSQPRRVALGQLSAFDDPWQPLPS